MLLDTIYTAFFILLHYQNWLVSSQHTSIVIVLLYTFLCIHSCAVELMVRKTLRFFFHLIVCLFFQKIHIYI